MYNLSNKVGRRVFTGENQANSECFKCIVPIGVLVKYQSDSSTERMQVKF